MEPDEPVEPDDVAEWEPEDDPPFPVPSAALPRSGSAVTVTGAAGRTTTGPSGTRAAGSSFCSRFSFPAPPPDSDGDGLGAGVFDAPGRETWGWAPPTGTDARFSREPAPWSAAVTREADTLIVAVTAAAQPRVTHTRRPGANPCGALAGLRR
ncbi:hypothetical protein [Streptomyces antibioticus]|uniref:hypothetical protein n=1 Tax=Streptomyces antibioticus TaxID=1890 RepID=UPI003D70A5E2